MSAALIEATKEEGHPGEGGLPNIHTSQGSDALNDSGCEVGGQAKNTKFSFDTRAVQVAKALPMDHVEAFRRAMEGAGLTPPDRIVDDGAFHRFTTNGRRKDQAGWYILRGHDIPSGSFGDWRTSQRQDWCSKDLATLTSSERAANDRRIAEARAKLHAEKTKAQEQAKALAHKRWEAASTEGSHTYLQAKGVGAHGVRFEGDRLLVPMRDELGQIHSLQTINQDGEKRYMADGRKLGCFHVFGPSDGPIVICEGYATGASIYEATGLCVAVAFDTSGLEPAANALHRAHPSRQIVVASDDDWKTEGNPGATKAAKAAQAVGGMVVPPIFGEDRSEKDTDFNDLAKASGLLAISDIFAASGVATRAGGPLEIDQDTGEVLEGSQELTKPAALLKSVSVFDVLTNPSAAPEFVWADYVPCGVVTLMGAHGGTGKSTIALMLAVCAAVGEPLFGAEVKPCKVLFASLEDSGNIVRHRLAHICQLWNIDPRVLVDRLFIVDGTENPELFMAEGRGAGDLTDTYRELSATIQDKDIGLVIVDNASDAFSGEEIQRRQVRAFIRALAMAVKPTNAGCLLLAHVDKTTSKARKAEGGEGYSGSTAWHNSARSRLFLTRGEDGLLTLEHQKSNLGKMRDPISMVWPRDDLPKLAAECTDLEIEGLIKRQQDGDGDEKTIAVLKLIAEFESREQYCSPVATARNNVLAMLKSDPAFQRLKLGADGCKRIVTQCQRAKWLEISEYRTHDRKTRSRWTLTADGRRMAGLSAPCAPSAPSSGESAESAGGAPSAPSY